MNLNNADPRLDPTNLGTAWYYIDCGTHPPTSVPTRLIGVPICPDLLRYEDIGAADNLRGRVVRVFFWLMRWWR